MKNAAYMKHVVMIPYYKGLFIFFPVEESESVTLNVITVEENPSDKPTELVVSLHFLILEGFLSPSHAVNSCGTKAINQQSACHY